MFLKAVCRSGLPIRSPIEPADLPIAHPVGDRLAPLRSSPLGQLPVESMGWVLHPRMADAPSPSLYVS
ncbi:MAG: hypothetical protein IGR80_05865 [Synechococcales cyanobacterium K44_A2020_017]|nr:hypothetical protein [Synechococcales cyanobacterium K32_A2020_035]MBF2094268.1 hypothetical protein [Synechococcales cyanobacterium K44_A2020_017]